MYFPWVVNNCIGNHSLIIIVVATIIIIIIVSLLFLLFSVLWVKQ